MPSSYCTHSVMSSDTTQIKRFGDYFLNIDDETVLDNAFA